MLTDLPVYLSIIPTTNNQQPTIINPPLCQRLLPLDTNQKPTTPNCVSAIFHSSLTSPINDKETRKQEME
ncbi:MAG: hypothetical protein MR912_10425, partial [Prevotella sp.]|nr:hypothetical protein [Prevotella sp.]